MGVNLIFGLIVLLKSVRCYLLQALPLLNADLQLNKCDRVITAYYSRFQIEFNPGVAVAVPMSNDIYHISSSYLAQCYPLMFYLNFLHSDLLLLQKCWCPDNVMHELVVTYSNKVCLCVSSIYLASSKSEGGLSSVAIVLCSLLLISFDYIICCRLTL